MTFRRRIHRRLTLEELEARVSPAVIFVDIDAPGANNGSSWSDAYVDLQDALSASGSGDDIWVAEGEYKPTSTTDRSIFFELVSGVDLYGGFSGGEAGLDQRNWQTNITVLSGDIGAPGDANDNSYRILNGASAILDGFTVTGANGATGMYNYRVSPVVRNCTFIDNDGTQSGAGMYNDWSSVTVTNSIFVGNSAPGGGGRSGTCTTPP